MANRVSSLKIHFQDTICPTPVQAVLVHLLSFPDITNISLNRIILIWLSLTITKKGENLLHCLEKAGGVCSLVSWRYWVTDRLSTALFSFVCVQYVQVDVSGFQELCLKTHECTAQIKRSPRLLNYSLCLPASTSFRDFSPYLIGVTEGRLVFSNQCRAEQDRKNCSYSILKAVLCPGALLKGT